MDHKKIHDNIIEKARSEHREKYTGHYYERHHIVPRCLGGTDDSDNLVLLTAREHFLVHWLLTKIYPEEILLVYALNSCGLGNSPHRGGQSWLYKFAREKYVELLKHNSEWKRKMGKTMEKLIWIKNDSTGECLRVFSEFIPKFEAAGFSRGRIIHHRRPPTEETKKKISNAHIGKKASIATSRKMSEGVKNRRWINDGKISKFVHKDRAQQLLQTGWSEGRINWNNPFAKDKANSQTTKT